MWNTLASIDNESDEDRLKDLKMRALNDKKNILTGPLFISLFILWRLFLKFNTKPGEILNSSNSLATIMFKRCSVKSPNIDANVVDYR